MLPDCSQDPLPFLFHRIGSLSAGPEHLHNEVLDGALQLTKVSVLQAVVAADVGGDVVEVGLLGIEGDVGVAAKAACDAVFKGDVGVPARDVVDPEGGVVTRASAKTNLTSRARSTLV